MKLKLIVDSLDDVPDHFHELYEAKGDKFVFVGVEGIKTQTDIDKLQTGLTKEREAHKVTKAKLALFGDLDPEEVHEKMDRFEELEAAADGKIDDAKIEQIVESRIKAKTGPLERKITQLENEKLELTNENETYKKERSDNKRISKVREAMKEVPGFKMEAEEDALLLAERVLIEDEEGNFITKDGAGVTPGLNPKEWLIELQPKKVLWFGPSEGGGSKPGTSGGAGGKNPWSAKDWNITEQNVITRQNMANAERMAKAAGSYIGATKPSVAK